MTMCELYKWVIEIDGEASKNNKFEEKEEEGIEYNPLAFHIIVI